MQRVDGESIADELLLDLKESINSIDDSPRLAIILVGENQASESFIEEKRAASERIGAECEVFRYGENASEREIMDKVSELNDDPDINGILIQLPIPSKLDENKLINNIDWKKDVDGLTGYNLGRFMRADPEISPATVNAVLELLEREDVSFKGKEITVINNSNLIGKPLSMALTNKGATVTICHKFTKDLSKHTKQADIIVTAVGEPGLLDSDMIKNDAFILDVGFSKQEGEIKGDLDLSELEQKARKVSPVPGGIGPITVAKTMENLLKCYNIQKTESEI